MPQKNNNSSGLRANKHSIADNRDILYCYVWSKQKARLCHGGYSKYMYSKWNELRADKPLSLTALATKGKRLYDRALKDLSANGWLGSKDLDQIRIRVEAEFGDDTLSQEHGSCDESSDCVNSPCEAGDGGEPTEQPRLGRPVSDDYEKLLCRAKSIFQDIKNVPIENQLRKRLKKKSLSSSMLNSVDWLSHDLIASLDQSECENLTIINTIIYTVAAVVSCKEGQEFSTGASMRKPSSELSEPRWKVRISKKIQQLRKEADILRACLDGNVKKEQAQVFLDSVMRKHHIDGAKRSVSACLFKIKNSISALAGKVRCYELNRKVKEQNELFNSDKKKFYRSIFEEEKKIMCPPSEADVRKFWEEKIWGNADKYTGQAEWLDELRKNYRNVKEQVWTGICENDVSAQLAKSMNWKAPGHDKISNFWLKSLPSVHLRLARCLNRCVECPEAIPDWMVKGKTTLLAKSANTSDASQFRPITCLTTLWKCLTGIVSEKMLEHLNSYNIIAVEQQGAIKHSYGTKTQLLINKSVVEDAMRRRKNLSMLFIDYSKAYDSVPHKWILEVLSVYKISPVIINFLAISMLAWKTDMFLYHEGGVVKVGNVQIRRGIFQGDGLSPLLFILSINPLSLLLNRRCKGYHMNDLHITHICYMDDIKTFSGSYDGLKKMAWLIHEFSSDIGMELGLSKCNVINLVRGKYAKLGGIMLKDGGVIEELGQDENYKYLGINELDGLKHIQMKEKIVKDAKTKLRKLLETELNGRNLVMSINECVLPVITYSFGIINWLESDLKACDVQIRKLMNMYKALEIKSDVDRIYVPRKQGGRGLLSVWDTFKSSVCRIALVLRSSNNELLTACCAVDSASSFSNLGRAEKFEKEATIEYPPGFHEKSVMAQGRIKAGCVRNSLTEKHISAWKAKPQHGAFMTKIESLREVDLKGSFSWLNKCHLDPHSESFIFAAQELALFSRYHEKNILKNREDDSCRVCGLMPETISHILFGCNSLARREYLNRHNNVCKYIHYTILQHYDIPCAKSWFAHKPVEVIYQKNVEIVYDQVIQTSRPIGANKPDIIVKDLASRKTLLIDISCPNDINVKEKEVEKVAKYQPLRAELRKLWGLECDVVPVVVGGLGVVSKDFGGYLAKLPGSPKGFMCQKISMLGSKRILSDVLSRR